MAASGSTLPTGYPPLEDGETPEQLLIMLSGKPYYAPDPYLCRLREIIANRVWNYNQERSEKARRALLGDLVRIREPAKKGNGGIGVMPPFNCEYGYNISLGYDVYVAPNAQFIDVNEIYIGDRTMLGCNVQLYTPAHPLVPELRNGPDGLGPEWAKPIRIGDDCWLGGGVVVVPGVTIGNGVTVGAGSVVTKDLPDRCVAVGNPARVIKWIKEDGTIVPADAGQK